MIRNMTSYFCFFLALCVGCHEHTAIPPTPVTGSEDSSSAQIAKLKPELVNEQVQVSEQAQEQKQAKPLIFPRVDGVYRTQKRSSLINVPNTDIFDYLVFKGGRCYRALGWYSDPDRHSLRQPISGGGGIMFSERESEIADQPKEIQSWLSEAETEKPSSGEFSPMKDGKLEARMKFPASQWAPETEVVYQCEVTPKGMRVTQTAISEGG